MKGKCNSVRVNPDMPFSDDDLCRFLFGVGVESFANQIKNDTSGKYDDLYKKDDGDEA